MPVNALQTPHRTARTPRSPLRSLTTFFRTPKGTMLLVLPALLVVAALKAGTDSLHGVAWAVAVAVFVDLAATRWRRGRWAFPSGALITGMLVAMVLAPFNAVYIPAATAGLAVVIKHVVRTRWTNVFNPAALALVASALLFKDAQSWWAALPDLGVLGFVLDLAAGWYIVTKIDRLPLALIFLGTSIALFSAAAFLGAAPHVAQVFRAPDIQMLLFFAAFMLTDPPTSPARRRDQIWFGLVVALAADAIFLRFGVQWFLLGGLLLGNACESLRRLAAQPQPRPTRGVAVDPRGPAVRGGPPVPAAATYARQGSGTSPGVSGNLPPRARRHR